MNNITKGTRLRVRFNTSRGVLNIEQLWDVNMTSLASLLKSLNEQIKEQTGSEELSFLEESSTKVDEILQLKFEIVKEIYIQRKSEKDAEKEAREVKQHNAKIDALIAQKTDEDLQKKSIEELEKMRK